MKKRKIELLIFFCCFFSNRNLFMLHRDKTLSGPDQKRRWSWPSRILRNFKNGMTKEEKNIETHSASQIWWVDQLHLSQNHIFIVLTTKLAIIKKICCIEYQQRYHPSKNLSYDIIHCCSGYHSFLLPGFFHALCRATNASVCITDRWNQGRRNCAIPYRDGWHLLPCFSMNN